MQTLSSFHECKISIFFHYLAWQERFIIVSIVAAAGIHKIKLLHFFSSYFCYSFGQTLLLLFIFQIINHLIWMHRYSFIFFSNVDLSSNYDFYTRATNWNFRSDRSSVIKYIGRRIPWIAHFTLIQTKKKNYSKKEKKNQLRLWFIIKITAIIANMGRNKRNLSISRVFLIRRIFAQFIYNGNNPINGF